MDGSAPDSTGGAGAGLPLSRAQRWSTAWGQPRRSCDSSSKTPAMISGAVRSGFWGKEDGGRHLCVTGHTTWVPSLVPPLGRPYWPLQSRTGPPGARGQGSGPQEATRPQLPTPEPPVYHNGPTTTLTPPERGAASFARTAGDTRAEPSGGESTQLGEKLCCLLHRCPLG